MKLDFFKDFKDPYMRKEGGQGVFLAGLVFGMIARGQAGKGGAIDSSPMYKQLHFGRMQRRDLSRLMARVPELTRVYDLPYAGMIESLCGEAGKRILEGISDELGVDGNFAFSIAFLNAPDYFWRIFKKQDTQDSSQEVQSVNDETTEEPDVQQLTLQY